MEHEVSVCVDSIVRNFSRNFTIPKADRETISKTQALEVLDKLRKIDYQTAGKFFSYSRKRGIL